MASKNHDSKGDIGTLAEGMLKPGGSTEEDPIKELKATILALEWEITEETVNNFQQQIDQLEALWQKDTACVLQLRILRGLVRHVDKAKTDVHPETLNLIFAVFNNMERMTSENLSKAEKQEIANQDLKLYEALRQRLGAGENASATQEETQPREPLTTAGVVSTMSDDEKQVGGDGALVQSALSHAADGADEGSTDSGQWKESAPLKEVDDRLDEFFGDDASGASAGMEEPAMQAPAVDSAELNPMPETTANVSGFSQEVGDRLNDFFADDEGLAPPAGGIFEGELPMTFDAPADAPPVAPAAEAPASEAQKAPAVEEKPLPPLNPEETPIKGLKHLVQSLGTKIDNATMTKLSREIQSFGDACQAEPGLQVLLTLLNSTGKTSKMLGKQTIPGSIELFRSLYASLEDLYASRTPTNGRACDTLASQAVKYTELQNKVLFFLVSTLVKKEKQTLADRKSSTALKKQVGQAKAAVAKAKEQQEKAVAAAQKVSAKLQKQLAMEQMGKDKALKKLEALRQDMTRQEEADAAMGFWGNLKKMFGGR